jgi:hypothetical protein
MSQSSVVHRPWFVINSGEHMASYKRALVIINPASGQHDPAETRQLLDERLTAEGVEYKIRETQEAGRKGRRTTATIW